MNTTGHPRYWMALSFARITHDPSLTPEMLDEHCKHSGLANFRRPRSYVFVHEIPRSPVGKLLRRCLVAGEYEPEKLPTNA